MVRRISLHGGRLAPLIGLLCVGCYLSHGRPEETPMDAAPPPETCCAPRCGEAECETGEVCTARGCEARCELASCSSGCCTGTELCGADGACTAPGEPCLEDRDCGGEQLCEPLVRRCMLPAAPDCRYTPPPGRFSPEVQWEYADQNVISMPLVVQLTDDDGDGDVDAADTPDVVVLGYDSLEGPARITALAGDDGRVHWQTDPAEVEICAFTTPAAADLDADGSIEIVAIVAPPGEVCRLSSMAATDIVIFRRDGSIARRIPIGGFTLFGMVSIADFDADGSPEIFALGTLMRPDGTILWRVDDLSSRYVATSIGDLDGDGRLEVAASDLAIDDDGSVLWRSGSVSDGSTAIARIIETPSSAGPQVVSVGGDRLEVLDGATGAVVFGPIVYDRGTVGASGPPTVADFDGDGRPEIGVATERRYIVFDPDNVERPILWSVASRDVTTGSVGSTVFDFDADGSAEVVYGDECNLQILSGRDGSIVWVTGSPSLTAYEYPVVVDVDGDGNAELVAVSNIEEGFGWEEECRARGLPFTDPSRGVRVYRDRLDNWVPTRSIWNQHAFHIDNVREDGTVPEVAPRSWESHNTFRLNRLADERGVTYAPNLAVTGAEAATESGTCGVPQWAARVENRGARGVAGGVAVAAYAPDGTLLGTGVTRDPLLPGGAEWVAIEPARPADELGEGTVTFVADDDGAGDGAHSECDEGDNRFTQVTVDCGS